jgi:hypothetical protein|tara:strand:- start:382 stop:537 length:156 start_codon:yes stop_codon:yes gene_type:complete
MAKKDKKIEEVVEEAPEPEPVAAPEERFIVYKKGGAKFWQYEDGRLEVCDE